MSQIKEYAEYATMAITLLLLIASILAKVFKSLGWNKGALIVDKIRTGLVEVKGEIGDARTAFLNNDAKVGNIDSTSAKAAAQISGVTADEIKPIIEKLVQTSGGTVAGLGVNVSINPTTGDINVDPSGVVSKAAHKITKWGKKLF